MLGLSMPHNPIHLLQLNTTVFARAHPELNKLIHSYNLSKLSRMYMSSKSFRYG